MPVPNSMADLATLAGSNYPTGTEPIGNTLDNYIRAISAILRSTNALASATIAAASTTDIGATDGEAVQITGAATINSFGVGFLGARRELRFSGACTLVNGANIQLGGNNIVTAAGDCISFRCTASGVWSISGIGATVRRNGDRMYGNFQLGAAGNPVMNLHYGGGTQLWISALDSTATNIASELWLRSAKCVWTNTTGTSIATMDNTGLEVGTEVRVGSVGNGAGRILASSGSIFWDSRSVINSGLPNANAFYRAALHTWTNGTGSGVATLDGVGNFTANGNVTGGSDERVKTNWRDLPEDFVERLAGVKHGIYDRTDIGTTQAGVGAQSLRDKVLPELVHEADDGFLSVAYGNAGLLGSIAVAQRLLALESRVRALEVE